MIRLDVQPGSGEWAMARLAIPTASQFSRILTPKTMKLSESATSYAHDLIAEEVLGVPLDDATSGFMNRGEVMERKAVDYYELQRDVDTEPAGFLLRDDGRVGASPDRLVGADGLLEIKVPKPANHITYLLDEQGIGYRAQVQGQLWITERAWVDTISYHPQMPIALVRQYRDEKFIAALAAAVDQFLLMLDDMKAKLVRKGLTKLKVPDLKVMAS